MTITPDELAQAGFRRAGVVRQDAAHVVRVTMFGAFSGFVVYLMVVNGEVKKAGTTGRKNSTLLEGRMRSTFSALRQVIRRGPPYSGDPFKTLAPVTVLAGKEVEIWARQCKPFRRCSLRKRS
jgi:hypothetical protein